MKRIFTLLLIFIPFLLLSQETIKKFYHSKSIGSNSIIYFNILNLLDDDEQTRVLGILLSDPNIFDGNIYFESKKTVCQLHILPTLGVEYVQNLIKSTGYEIDESSLMKPNSSKQEGFYYSKAYSFFSGFDGFKGYDVNNSGAKSREDAYQENKDNWIKSHPEEYKKAVEENGSTVIVKRKDLDIFTEQKKQYILNHPEMFIIEN